MDFCNQRNQPVDKASCYMYEAMRKDGVETIYERFAAQQPQCNFGANGICCTLCSHGPCQITRKADKGVCGADADLIVARNLLHKVAIGTAANVYHARNVARTIEAIGKGESDYWIKEEDKLRNLAETVGLDSSGSKEEVALSFGKFFLDQINSPDYEPLKLVEAFAIPQRKELWKKLDIFPGGPNSEILTSLTKSMTNVNSDPVDLLLQALRLGIVNEYVGLLGATLAQEVIIGTAKLFSGEANIGIINKDYVNLLINGHQPILAIKVMEMAREEEFVEKAKKAGASGIKFYGSVCEGQSLMNISSEYGDVYAGPAGNLIQQELILGTGAIDVMFFDFNCVLPSLVDIAERYHTKLISTDKVVRQGGGTERLEYEPDQALKISRKILDAAITAFPQRNTVNLPQEPEKAMAGFTTESVLDALGGSLKPLIDLIADGTIKGVAAIVGCTTVRDNQSGFNTAALARELIKKDILVISAGCASNSLQNHGLLNPGASALAGENLRKVCESLNVPPCFSYGGCTDIGKIVNTVSALAKALDVDISQLPIAVSAPEWMEQKAVADGFTAVALGTLVHLAPVPPVLGSELVTKVLTQDVEGLTGGKVYVELDPIKAAEGIETHIIKKREGLNLKTAVEVGV